MIDLFIVVCAKYLIYVSLVVLVLYFLLAPRVLKYHLVWLAAISMTLAYALARIASDLYLDPRPFVIGHFKPLVEHAADNGFPSDHMLLASTIAALIFYFNRRMGIVLWVIAILVAYGRVASGVHHTVDVVASAAIGIVAVVIGQFILSQVRRRPVAKPPEEELV
jgi:undecaprenyl-diphosphatase